jgi:hypothetical protein
MTVVQIACVQCAVWREILEMEMGKKLEAKKQR